MTEKQINLLLNVSDVTRSEIIEAFPEMEEVFKREDEEWEAERQRAHDAWVAAGKPPRVGLLDFQPVLKDIYDHIVKDLATESLLLKYLEKDTW